MSQLTSADKEWLSLIESPQDSLNVASIQSSEIHPEDIIIGFVQNNGMTWPPASQEVHDYVIREAAAFAEELSQEIGSVIINAEHYNA